MAWGISYERTFVMPYEIRVTLVALALACATAFGLAAIVSH